MKRILMILLAAVAVFSASAQPQKRRAEQQKQNTGSAQQLSMRAQISFPTAQGMSEDVVWRRDIYRELDLNEDANAGLYYPVEPIGSQMNLFTYIFKLMMTGRVKVYEYRLDGNEVFTDEARVVQKTFLDNYHIFYEKDKNGRTRIDNSDIPSREVKGYYIKESAYYDQASATFHTKVLALCPIMSREDDFGDGAAKYPLFWVKYEDIAPFLSKQTIMTSNLNNAATMSVDDYFTKNMYRGKIYKTTNMLGKTLAQYCSNDSAMAKEQKRIENELQEFEKNIWGNRQRKDSLDSIANDGNKKVKKQKRSRRDNVVREEKPKVKNRRNSSSSSNSGSQPRVSVRRQRR
ncbi:gliding motility protein GldN [Prevotella sp. OH937_COT-195]|uniref:type IX secretion system ring protein PorN/GldN n=1 Tax=Prevotella sp. OH937_COT-195 TaxID=2491051 RepID=UPI000F64C546|nr:gliding motility protein GldN [Prevotella sp. OH937_COT-195]RRC99451.1 gliding motility protein GldN [Prevotella sp. OH937_COT-195]